MTRACLEAGFLGKWDSISRNIVFDLGIREGPIGFSYGSSTPRYHMLINQNISLGFRAPNTSMKSSFRSYCYNESNVFGGRLLHTDCYRLLYNILKSDYF